MPKITISAHAKVNLFLEIKGKRKDSFHEIVTLYQEIGLYDEICLTRTRGYDVIFHSEPPFVIDPSRNLCLYAFEALRQRIRLRDGLEISLKKNIPIGSGLGGGSSDAAAVIKGANQLFGLGLREDEMESIAAEVGSDVPFFIRGGTAIGRGRGTELEHLPDFAGGFCVVVLKPKFSISTEEAYRWVDDCEVPSLPLRKQGCGSGEVRKYDEQHDEGTRELDPRELKENFKKGNIEYLAGILHNDFEQFVFPRHHELEQLKEKLIKSGCRGALLAGSGSALFGICDSESAAAVALSQIKGDFELAGFYKAGEIE